MGGVDLSTPSLPDRSQEKCPRPCGRGGFKRWPAVQPRLPLLVPARVGGVDLSHVPVRGFLDLFVPARVGGVDLSGASCSGFSWTAVPARVGGVDLSTGYAVRIMQSAVPARVGGVDLSSIRLTDNPDVRRPRPCGRGGFKHEFPLLAAVRLESPPVWAGWI